MTQYFQNLDLAQNRRMRYILMAYLFSILVGVIICLYFSNLPGMMSALLVSFLLSKKLTGFVYKKIKAPCPLCDAQELSEKFTLQCRSEKYQCEDCNSIYMKGVLIEK